MTKVYSTKRSLITSVIALMLCFSMLLGTTFAWFTDSVTSANNIIKSGNLDVEMYWADGTEAVPTADAGWTDASTGAIFDYDKWEPGYTEVRHIKIANKGTLALKYQLAIVANKEVSKLSDVIDVYYADPAVQVANRTALTDANKIGTLTQVLAGMPSSTYGELQAGNFATITLALKMQESAGNEYQNLSIGSDFRVILSATQLAAEGDSFNNEYDVKAAWLGDIPADLAGTTLNIAPAKNEKTGTITINSPEDLVYLNKLAKEWVSLYSNGQGTSISNYYENVGGKGADYYYHWSWTVKLGADLDMNNIPMVPIDLTYWGSFDGQGHTISNVVVDAPDSGHAGIFSNACAISNLNVKNIKVIGAKNNDNVGAVVGFCRSTMTNVHVENATIEGNKYVGAVAGKVTSGITNSSANNSTVKAINKTAGGLVGYTLGDTNGNIVNNVTVTGTYNVGGLLGQAQDKTVENNTVKNVTVTSTTALPSDANASEKRTGKVVARIHNAIVGTNTTENVTIVEKL